MPLNYALNNSSHIVRVAAIINEAKVNLVAVRIKDINGIVVVSNRITGGGIKATHSALRLVRESIHLGGVWGSESVHQACTSSSSWLEISSRSSVACWYRIQAPSIEPPFTSPL